MSLSPNIPFEHLPAEKFPFSCLCNMACSAKENIQGKLSISFDFICQQIFHILQAHGKNCYSE